MKNAILLLLFILGLASCTIEKRRYFKGYHVENGRMGEWGNGKMSKRDPSTGSGTREAGKRESAQARQSAESHSQKPQRGDIIIEGDNINEGDDITANDLLNTGETTPASEAEKPQRGNSEITSLHDIITAISPTPISSATQIFEHHKSQALEGAGKLFLLGLITLVVLIALVIFLVSNGAVTAVLLSLIVGLALALGIYLLLLLVFFALLMFIIKTFGS